MPHSNDTEYYAQRAEAARELAGRAVDPSIKNIHARMASDYGLLAQANRPPVLRAVKE